MKLPLQNLRWCIAYWISRTGARLGRHLPARFCYALAIPVADVCYLFARNRRNAVKQNLRRVVGEAAANRAARRVFRNFARYVIDFYQLPSLSQEALRRRMDFDDWPELTEALSDPHGAILITMHIGQAELGAGALASYGHEVSAIAETFDYQPMNDFIQGLRRQLGMKVIPAYKARMGVLRCLSRGEALAMMVDVIQPGDGIEVDFFGEQHEFSSAPARIALRTGSRVLAGVVARSENDPTRLMPLIDFDLRYEITGDEETDVHAITQAIATSLEGYVRRFPDQWFAFRPAWRDGEVETARWKLWALNAAVKVGAFLPRLPAYALARIAGDLAYRFRHAARADVRDNMRHVLGTDAPDTAVDAAARDAFRNVARYYVDLVRLPRMNLERRIDDLAASRRRGFPVSAGKDIRLHGFDILTSRIESGQGAVVSTAHFGNPELAVQVGAILGLDILVLAEPLDPPEFADTMKRLRSAFGPRYEDVSFGAIADSIRHLRSGGVLAITCDRDIQHKGVPVPFFGAETRLPLGAVELAARTGAALIPACCRRSGDGFEIHFEEPLQLIDTGNPRDDALANTRALIARAEAWIASDPGQWMVLERIWKPLTKRAIKRVAPDKTSEPLSAG
jgi:lauroyl/myristoyl acyltransferase